MEEDTGEDISEDCVMTNLRGVYFRNGVHQRFGGSVPVIAR